MRRHPPISFRGALQILGSHEHPWLQRLDSLCGGLILSAGLAPVEASVSAMWGWVDQKNEAAGLLRTALGTVSDRILDTGGLQRHELVVAAHTALVMSSLFDALAESPLGDALAEAEVSDREKLLLAGVRQELADETVKALYTLEVPAPSAAAGFHATAIDVFEWALGQARVVAHFVEGIVLDDFDGGTDDGNGPVVDGLGPEHRPTNRFGRDIYGVVAEGTKARYEAAYLELAGRVPEFRVWADLVEHGATQTALTRMQQLLSATVAAIPSHRDLLAVVRQVNQAVLRQPVLDIESDGYGDGTTFPSLEDLFVDPRCKITIGASLGALLSGVISSTEREKAEDVGVVLARHFSSAQATTLPLLLLGHPGAGKSLLTKVIAARLPDLGYTVVRVPLRHVEANATVPVQIQEALDAATHNRVPWPDLVEQSADRIRVVLLDGLDELLQAGTGDRADYLHRIVEFQRTEAALGYPVAVVVTARTLVVDRISLPAAMPVAKLEDFDHTAIREWVRRWNVAQTAPGSAAMTAAVAHSHPQLAAQPLLLLLLTLYYTSRDRTGEATTLSSTHLYQRLVADYAQREATKKAGRRLHGDELDDAIETQLRALSIAALGMFNRGRQDITEADLTADLTALEGQTSAGERVLGEFFFIHAPEARETSTVRRSYEFLHATFGEYLVAAHVIDVLRDTAESALGRRKRHEPDDNLLRALLSHQPLAIQSPVLQFADDLLVDLQPEELDWARATLDTLVAGYSRGGASHRFVDYRPLTPDALRAMACYTANLVLLRIRQPLGDTGVPLARLFPNALDSLHAWRGVVDLWRAGLDEQGYHAILSAVDLVDRNTVAREGLRRSVPHLQYLHHARLRGDDRLLSRLRHGHAARDGVAYLVLRGSLQARFHEWTHYTSTWLSIATTTAVHDAHRMPPLAMAPAPQFLDVRAAAQFTTQAIDFLGAHGTSAAPHFVAPFLQWLSRAVPRAVVPDTLTSRLDSIVERVEQNQYVANRQLTSRPKKPIVIYCYEVVDETGPHFAQVEVLHPYFPLVPTPDYDDVDL